MRQYQFVTTWHIDAPAEAVFEALVRSEQWPEWWRGVTRVEELEPGDEHGLGNLRRYTFRSLLPYDLTFDMRSTVIDPPSVLEGQATGDLVGTGRWTLLPNERGVTVRYDWNVGTSQPWMNALAPFIGPLFTWNHDLVMRWGEDGLREHLGIAPVERDEDPERTLRRRLVIAGGVAVALFMTVRNWRRGRSRD